MFPFCCRCISGQAAEQDRTLLNARATAQDDTAARAEPFAQWQMSDAMMMMSSTQGIAKGSARALAGLSRDFNEDKGRSMSAVPEAQQKLQS